jgi:hypothetical protein
MRGRPVKTRARHRSYDDLVGRLVSKLRFLRTGVGSTDSVSVVLHYRPNGKVTSLDAGT